MNNISAEFVKSIRKYKNIMIIIQGSPDPDAIASSYAIKVILRHLSIDSEIFASKKLSLSQNKAFVRLLQIPLGFVKVFKPGSFDAYIITDFQNNRVPGVSEHIPCAAHIDHHRKDDKIIPSDFSFIRTDSGATSTLISHIIKNSEFTLKDQELKSISTALMFGIQTDTDSYEHLSELDLEALKFLSSYADMSIINRINGIPMSAMTITCYNHALNNAFIYKDWGFYGIGFIDISHRDSLAIVADIILKKSGLKTVAVFSIVTDTEKKELFLDVSLRTKISTLDLNSLIKKITPTGGGRAYKGAYQVKLDYFRSYPEREILWQTVETATIDWLKKGRDSAYLHEITGTARNLFRKASSLLKN